MISLLDHLFYFLPNLPVRRDPRRHVITFPAAVPYFGDTLEEQRLSIYDAVHTESVWCVSESLRERGADVDAIADSGRGGTALMAAVAYSSLPIVNLLLDEGASTSVRNTYGVTALHLACNHGDSLVIAALLEAGADENFRDPEGHTPAMLLAQMGHTEGLRELVRHGSPHIDARNDAGATSLMLASVGGHANTVKALISAGADVCLRNMRGFTALHFAAQSGSTPTLLLLLGRGSDPVCRSEWGKRSTPLHLAVMQGHSSSAKELVRAGAQPSAPDGSRLSSLYWLIHQGHSTILHELLEVMREREEAEQTTGRQKAAVSVTVSSRDKYHCGQTLLHVAASFNRFKSAAILLRAGALETVKDFRGDLPSHHAGCQAIVDSIPSKHSPNLAACMRRLLEKGPAFRGVSWLWPIRRQRGADCGDLLAMCFRPCCGKATPTYMPTVRVYIAEQETRWHMELTNTLLR